MVLLRGCPRMNIERNTSTSDGVVKRLATDEYRNGIRVLLMVLLRDWPQMNFGTEYEYCWWCFWETGHRWISERNTSTADGASERLATDEYRNGIRVLLMVLLRDWPQMNIGTEYEYCWWCFWETGHRWISERNTSTADGAVNRTGSVVKDSDWGTKYEGTKRWFGCYLACILI
jgi:hypothetical protein